jgi:outer membrane protein TolC
VNQRYQTILATQQAFFTALANADLVRVGQANLDRAKEQVQIAVNRFQAGAATRSDTLTATVDLGNARLALLQAQANLATAQANLARQIGVNGSVHAVPDSVFPPLPDTTGLRAAALGASPVVTQAEAQARAAGADVWSARSQYWPSLSVAYSNSRTGTESPQLPLFSNGNEAYAWRFALTWTLFDGLQRERSQVSAGAARDLANAEAADARRQVDAQLTQYLAAMLTAYAQIGITGANVDAATEARRVQQERYRLGAATLLDLLTAEADMTQAEVLQVQARYAYLNARAQVEALVGRTL